MITFKSLIYKQYLNVRLFMQDNPRVMEQFPYNHGSPTGVNDLVFVRTEFGCFTARGGRIGGI